MYKVIKIINNTYRQTMDSVRYSQQLVPGNAVQNQLPDLLVVERTTYLRPVQVYECVIEIENFFRITTTKVCNSLTRKKKSDRRDMVK